MASEEAMTKAESVLIATRLVEVFASTADALLQQWLEQGQANDRLGMALTSVKIAQLGLLLTNYFKAVGEDFIDGQTELKAARQAVKQLDDMVRRSLTQAGVKGFATDTTAEGDSSLN